MLYVEGANNIEPNAKLEDIKLIGSIATKCGFKYRIIGRPVQTPIVDSTVSSAESGSSVPV